MPAVRPAEHRHEPVDPQPAAPVAALAGLELDGAVVRHDDDGAAVLKLPNDLPVSVRLNTDDTVSVTIGHGDDGSALLADLRSLVR